MIHLKSEKEIQTMKEGGHILADILKELARNVRPGMTTNELEKLARELISSHPGAKPSFLGYDGYPAALCTSVNDEIVHGIPSERILENRDVLKIDAGILYKGFHTDSAITVLVGGGDSAKSKLINVTKESLRIGISKAKVGNTLGDIGAAIRKYVEDNGFNVVRDLVGHGIGKNLHEEPQVLNYGKPAAGPELVAGMVLAIEPMVVTGSWKIKDGKDSFSFVTKDGGLAAHFEHTVAVTKNGPLVLTE